MECGEETPLSPPEPPAAELYLCNPIPSLGKRGCSVLLKKQVHLPTRVAGQGAAKTRCVAPVCMCKGVTVSVDLPDVEGSVPGANLPSSHQEHPSSECSGDSLPLAATVSCVWLTNGEGPPQERTIQGVEEAGKFQQKGTLFLGLNHSRPRWKDLETKHKPHRILRS